MVYDLLWLISSTALIWFLAAPIIEVGAQGQRTATPIVVSLVTATPANIQSLPPTVTSAPTATLLGPTLLQAPETAGNINVRAAPDLDSEILGTISFGALYPALRRYFQWYELSYAPAPNGRAWVYGELVEISGDLGNIQVVDNFADINVFSDNANNAAAGSGELAAASDEESRILVISTESGASRQSEAATKASPLPTFTRPPDLPAIIPTGALDSATEGEDRAVPDGRAALPPLFPIVMLAGFGVVGLLINLIRQ